MKRLATIAMLAGLVFSAALGAPPEPMLVSGTYREGSNVTEPRSRKSEYLETLQGGIVVMGERAGFYLNTKVIKHPANELYVVVEYENPSGGAPAVNDMPLKPDAEELQFSSPDFVTGLRIYADYTITVRVFAARGSKTPIDTLKQKVRCYVDTRGPKAKLFKGLKTDR